MIITFLTGGLGNQMFQYAVARCLAEKQSTILKVDVSGFEVYKLHRYSLHCFHIWEYLATQAEINEILDPVVEINTTILGRFQRFFNNSHTQSENLKNLYQEKDFRFNPTILDSPNNIYLKGYWQSEKYFLDIENIIRREFTIKYPQDSQSREVNELIQSTNSVSLHIRRQDYVSNSTSNKFHGICSFNYYKQSIEYLFTKVQKPHFFIFSDDMDWVKDNLENLGIHFPVTLVDHNDALRNYEDLRLMSQCQHNIIANSSFSWWGAWLNANPHKIVICPDPWFDQLNWDTRDLIPPAWIKLPR